MSACSCGNPEPHEVARRLSFDERVVLVWSDGRVTGSLGHYVPGGAVPEAFRVHFIDMICTCTRNELSALIRAAKRVCSRKGRPTDLRAAVVREAFPEQPRKELGVPWSATAEHRDFVEHVRNCRAIHCRSCKLGVLQDRDRSL